MKLFPSPNSDASLEPVATTGSEAGWDWTIAFDGTRTPVKTALFVLVCLVWIIPGLIGHEPWKGDEAATFGVVFHMLKSGEWLVPMLAGEPFLDRPPLYYWVATLLAKTLSFALPVHDAARLASGFFTGVALLFTALASRALLGSRFGRVTVIILIGTLGLLLRVHEMISDTALFAAFAMGYYGLAVGVAKPRWGALWLGLGIGCGFLARGFIAPALLGSIAVALPVFFRYWRIRSYVQFLIVALLIALPLVLVWPAILEYRSRTLFNQWFYVNNWDPWRVQILSSSSEGLLYYLRLLPWYTWPALPMAAWTLWRAGREGLTRPEIQLSLVGAGATFLVLSLGSDVREVNALPILIPLSVLAAAGIDTLRRGAVSALDWFGMMTFGVFSAALWLGWFALIIGAPGPFVTWIKNYQPNFEMPFRGFAFSVALALSLIYVATITRSRRSNRRAIVNWTAGITLFWMLAMTLWLPLIDAGRSYRGVMAELQNALPAQYNCVASSNLGDAQRALLDYYIGLITKRVENKEGAQCHVLLVQGVAGKEQQLSVLWKKFWEGSRPGDKVERLRLYRRD
ncbi:MAG: glycosyltransferase family 39 protein [Burkholderiales bacterium]|nr:glycosyltransferase family 39 protein [Burkholderiales bacterium]